MMTAFAARYEVITHDISSMLAEKLPCMCGSATLVMLVSSTCITVTIMTENVMAHLRAALIGASGAGAGGAVTSAGSLDDFVRPGQDGGRDRQSEGTRGLEVEDQLELRRLLDRQVRRPCALQDAVDVRRRTAVHVVEVRTVRHEAAEQRVRLQPVHGRQPVLVSERDDASIVGFHHEWIPTDHHRVGLGPYRLGNGGLESGQIADVHVLELDAERAAGRIESLTSLRIQGHGGAA